MKGVQNLVDCLLNITVPMRQQGVSTVLSIIIYLNREMKHTFRNKNAIIAEFCDILANKGYLNKFQRIS